MNKINCPNCGKLITIEATVMVSEPTYSLDIRCVLNE